MTTTPNWLADDDLLNISKTVIRKDVPIQLEVDTSFTNPHMFGIVCPCCKTKGEDRQVWTRDTKINGMDGMASNGDYITFYLECENCETGIELECGKRGGFYMKMTAVRIE